MSANDTRQEGSTSAVGTARASSPVPENISMMGVEFMSVNLFTDVGDDIEDRSADVLDGLVLPGEHLP